MFNFTYKLFYAALFITLLTGLNACTKFEDDDLDIDNPNMPSDKYAIWVQTGSWPNTAQYVVGANSLTSGAVSLAGNGSAVTSVADYGIIAHNGFYYYPSTSSSIGRFSKFTLKKSKLSIVKEVPFTYQTGVTSYAWANDSTLILIGTNGAGDKVLCSVVDINTLNIRNSELSVHAIPAGYQGIVTRGVEYANGKLYVGLAYTAIWPAPAYPKAVVAIFDFPSLSQVTQLEDARSVGMGQSDMWMSGSTVDEKGDVYYLATPGWLSTTLPSAVYRIKNGTAKYDPDYFFNLNTSSLGAPAIALWGIGGSQAIVKYQALPNDNSDAQHIFGYAVIDLANGRVIRKLTEVPLDKGEMLETVLVEGNNAYIMANSLNGKDYIWVYDIANGTANPGLEIAGGYDYMLRIDKLK